MSKSIRQTVAADTGPGVIPVLSMDSRVHAACIGVPAEMSRGCAIANAFAGHVENITGCFPHAIPTRIRRAGLAKEGLAKRHPGRRRRIAGGAWGGSTGVTRDRAIWLAPRSNHWGASWAAR
jgi:hypothetical protein